METNEVMTTHENRPSAYEPPKIIAIGEASRVVLGLPGGGFDGPFGLSDPRFEFESDES